MECLLTQKTLNPAITSPAEIIHPPSHLKHEALSGENRGYYGLRALILQTKENHMFRILLRGLREGLGRLVILVDFITRPKPMARSKNAQASVDAATESLSLYQFHACPFCVKTRRAMRRLNISMDLRDAQHDREHRQTLHSEGGAIKVPCLRVDRQDQVKWLYESTEIIRYLDTQFGEAALNESNAQ